MGERILLGRIDCKWMLDDPFDSASTLVKTEAADEYSSLSFFSSCRYDAVQNMTNSIHLLGRTPNV